MNKYSEENLRKIIERCFCFSDVLRELNLSTSGRSSRIALKKNIEKFQIDITHFLSRSELLKKRKWNVKKKIDLSLVLVSGSTYNNTDRLKKRLYVEELKKRECELCGQGEMWQGKKMSLILDHINGIHNDNRIENLRIVCPNCNATLETTCRGFKGLNKKNKIINKINLRKVERPPFEQLKNEIKKMGYVGTGKKYGVSDNSIRKWEKHYLKYNGSVVQR